MPDYYFITSKLNGNVLTIQNANPAPITPVVSSPRQASDTDSQLWTLLPTGPESSDSGQSQYYIQSKLNGNVLDIEGANPQPLTRIISYPIDYPSKNNQIWQLNESDIEGYFYIISLLNNNVVDIEGSNTAPGAPIISYPQNPSVSDNQIWALVLETQSSPKKSAFA